MQEIIKDRLYTFEQFISDDICNYLINYVKQNLKGKINIGYIQDICHNNELIDKYNDMILGKLPFNAQLSNIVFMTYYSTGQGIGMHRDGRRNNEKYKLLIYLNTVPKGGETVFYDDDENVITRISAIKGNAIMFDVKLLHSGEKVAVGEKYAVGFRIIV